MTVHVNVNHLQQRNFICEREGCGRAFGYKHLLQRHCARLHGVHSAESDEEGPDVEDKDDMEDQIQEDREEESFIEALTGRAYKRRRLENANTTSTESSKSNQKKKAKKVLHCPWPHFISGHGEGSMHVDPGKEAQGLQTACQAIFHRGYDLRRHLKADHGLELDKEEMAAWVE
jgi:general transcription factor IIIA